MTPAYPTFTPCPFCNTPLRWDEEHEIFRHGSLEGECPAYEFWFDPAEEAGRDMGRLWNDRPRERMFAGMLVDALCEIRRQQRKTGPTDYLFEVGFRFLAQHGYEELLR